MRSQEKSSWTLMGSVITILAGRAYQARTARETMLTSPRLCSGAPQCSELTVVRKAVPQLRPCFHARAAQSTGLHFPSTSLTSRVLSTGNGALKSSLVTDLGTPLGVLSAQVYYSASLQKQRIQDAMTQGLYEKTRDSQEVRAT